MKRLLFAALAFLLVMGIGNFANADAIPTVVSAKDEVSVWTQTVYCNAAVVSGYVVQWDFGTSNPSGTDKDDMCPWVKTSDADNDIWTAGVVPIDTSYAAGSTFDMIIRGPAYVVNELVTGETNDAPDVNAVVSASDTGTVIDEGAAEDKSTLGICITASGGTNRTDLGAAVSIIYIDPTHEGD